jgi:hypothetical protein
MLVVQYLTAIDNLNLTPFRRGFYCLDARPKMPELSGDLGSFSEFKKWLVCRIADVYKIGENRLEFPGSFKESK